MKELDLIVLEGVDKAGKTSLAKQLSKEYGFTYIKPDYQFEFDAVDDYIQSQQVHQKLFFDVVKLLNQRKKLVVDRWMLSTFVYLHIKENLDKIHLKLQNIIEHQIRMFKFIEEELGKRYLILIAVAQPSYIQELKSKLADLDDFITPDALDLINSLYIYVYEYLHARGLPVKKVMLSKENPLLTVNDVGLNSLKYKIPEVF